MSACTKAIGRLQMFKTQEFTATDAALSYPLVSCRYPGLSLSRWTDYVRAPQRRGVSQHLAGLVDAKGRIHAVFGYDVETADGIGAQLHVAHIATFRLAGNAIYRAFDQAIEQIARENACREVTIVPWGGVAPGDGPTLTPEDIAPGRRILSIETGLEQRSHPH